MLLVVTRLISKGLISITAIGEANEDEIVYRNGAKQTDLLVVTGDIGAAYMGLQVLEREKSFSGKPQFTT
jgi:thiamine monophosphate kinase